MHCAAQIRAEILVIGLDCFVQSGVGALVVIDRSVVTLDVLAKPSDRSDDCGDGMSLRVNGGGVVACAVSAHGVEGVVGVDAIQEDDHGCVGVRGLIDCRVGNAQGLVQPGRHAGCSPRDVVNGKDYSRDSGR